MAKIRKRKLIPVGLVVELLGENNRIGTGELRKHSDEFKKSWEDAKRLGYGIFDWFT